MYVGLYMNTGNSSRMSEKEMILKGTLLLNAKVLGLVLGLVIGLAVFLATNWLVIKGGSQVGPHLRLLSQYFIGFAYGFALGTLSGAFIGWVYNKIAKFRV
jgi:hypothetical protein